MTETPVMQPETGTWTQAPAPPPREHKPTCDWPMSEAVNQLRGDELFQIFRHFAVKDIPDMGTIQLLVGTVWAFENRREHTSFSTVSKWTVAQLTDYFQPEPVEPEDPIAQKSGDE